MFVAKRHDDLYEKVLPFFRRFPLRSEKQQEVLKFEQVVEMMHCKEHLTLNGLIRIGEIAFSMNGARFRKYGLTKFLQSLEPSETIRQASAASR